MKRQKARIKKVLIHTLLELPVLVGFLYFFYRYYVEYSEISGIVARNTHDLWLFTHAPRFVIIVLTVLFFLLLLFWQYQFRVFFYLYIKPSNKRWINILRHLSYLIWAVLMIGVNFLLADLLSDSIRTILRGMIWRI